MKINNFEEIYRKSLRESDLSDVLERAKNGEPIDLSEFSKVARKICYFVKIFYQFLDEFDEKKQDEIWEKTIRILSSEMSFDGSYEVAEFILEQDPNISSHLESALHYHSNGAGMLGNSIEYKVLKYWDKIDVAINYVTDQFKKVK